MALDLLFRISEFLVYIYSSMFLCILIGWCWDTRKVTHLDLKIIAIRILLVLFWPLILVKAFHRDSDYIDAPIPISGE